MDLRKRLREDWEKQPLAIVTQVIAIAVTISLFVLGAIDDANFAIKTGPKSAYHQIDFKGLALLAGICSVFATISGKIYRKTIIGGFFISLFLAGFCLFIAAVIQPDQLRLTSKINNSAIDGPLIDLQFWFVVCIFISIAAVPVFEKIVTTWGAIPRKNENGELERGVSPLEIAIFWLVWGVLLSSAQQKILSAFVMI